MNENYVNENSPDTCCDQTPKGIETQTQLTPDMLPVYHPENTSSGTPEDDTPTEEELIESVVEINPDINSMDSRG